MYGTQMLEFKSQMRSMQSWIAEKTVALTAEGDAVGAAQMQELAVLHHETGAALLTRGRG